MKTTFLSLIVLAALLVQSCQNKQQNTALSSARKKVGVLLVNHGSRSATWRQALLDLETAVKDSILSSGLVAETKTAFMEYTEPSVATRLKEFDAEGFTDVIIIPIFLTVSPHTFDDIPTIIGQKEDPKSLEVLKVEKIERYTPKAATHIAPLLDFSGLLKNNILRRTKALSQHPASEGLVMIAYGDETYVREWSSLLNEVGDHVNRHLGIDRHSFGWCGHIAHYNPDSTTIAINRVLKHKEKALVVPVLVAHDEMFQVKIIGDGIAKVTDAQKRVVYKPDAILPDQEVSHWVIRVAQEYATKINEQPLASR